MHSLRLTVKAQNCYRKRCQQQIYKKKCREYRKVCRYIAETVQVHPGRYLVFFPSYGYLQQVKENYEQMYKPDEIIMGAEGGTPKLTAEQNLIVQLPSMKEQEKENFLSLFENVQEVEAF